MVPSPDGLCSDSRPPRVQALGDLAQFLQHSRQPGGSPVQLLHRHTGPGRCRRLRGPQLEGERDQVLLGAVVQVTLDPAAGGIGRRHDPCP